MAKYRLDEIAPVQQGEVDSADKYWLLNLDMVESNTGRIIDYVYCDKKDIGNSTVVFDEKNVLYSKLRPYLNKVVLPTKAGYATSEMLPLRPNPDIVTRAYLTYFLRSPRFVSYISEKTSGAKMPRANSSDLKACEIECPDLSVQNKITTQFDTIVSIIDSRRRELEQLDNLIKARFVELYGDPSLNTKGYPVKSLPEIAEYWNGLTYKPEDVADEGTIVLRSSNIQNAQLDFEDTVRVSCPIGDKKYVKDNDILMCSRNGSARLVGKVALIKNIAEPMSFGAFMMIIRSRYYPYLMTFFQLPAFRAQITTGATTTINQITGRMLDNVKLPVPEEAELDSFISFIEQIDKSKVAVQKALNEAQLLFDSLMQEYFG